MHFETVPCKNWTKIHVKRNITKWMVLPKYNTAISKQKSPPPFVFLEAIRHIRQFFDWQSFQGNTLYPLAIIHMEHINVLSFGNKYERNLCFSFENLGIIFNGASASFFHAQGEMVIGLGQRSPTGQWRQRLIDADWQYRRIQIIFPSSQTDCRLHLVGFVILSSRRRDFTSFSCRYFSINWCLSDVYGSVYPVDMNKPCIRL